MAFLDHSRLAFIAIIIATLPCLVIVLRKKRTYVKTPHPPGPHPYPVIGNLCDFPVVQPWVTYTQWQKKYGDIVYSYALGQHVIILNSLKVAVDLFEKRSQMYSDRPVIPMRDILGWDFVLGLMFYGDAWRNNRRTLHQKYRPDAALAYRPTQMKKIHELLRNLLIDPTEFIDHYKHMAASVIMATVYGYESAPKDDPFLDNADKAITLMTNSMFPGSSIVNSLPFLRFFPSWFPGSQFHKAVEECRILTTEMLDMPFNYVKKNLATSTATPCLVSELIEKNERDGGSTDGEQMIKGLAATSFSAGADTVACVIGSFFLAAVTNPEARKKAQARGHRPGNPVPGVG